MTMLTAVATHTSTLELATGVALLPQRNPVYFAKIGTGIDLLSNGRFLAGIGLGWSAQEYAALATPFEHRGSRMRDYIQVVRSLWCDDTPHFEGEFYSLPSCLQLPRPTRRPHPPFYIGGESDAALRRVAEFGQGWVGLQLTPGEVGSRKERLDRLLAEHGRSIADIDIVVSQSPKDDDVGNLPLYAALGVSQLIVTCDADNLDSFRRKADRLAEKYVYRAQGLTRD